MRILQINKLYPPAIGGVEAHVATLSRRLSELPGMSVTVVCAGDRWARKEEMDGNVRVVRLPSLGHFRSAPVAWGFGSEMLRVRADILHFHFPYPPAAISYLRARPRGRVVVTWHSDIVRQRALLRFLRRPLREFLDRADRILVTSPRLLEFSPQLSPYRTKCVVVPLGIEVSGLAPGPETQPLTILCAGRLVYYKGHAVLLDALARLRGQPWLLEIAGEGPLERSLRKKATTLGIAEQVRFRGRVSDSELHALLRSCAVLAMPSVASSEAFGLVQLEAFASAKPVVSTDLPTGVPYVNLHCRTGFVVPPGDSAALAQALGRLLADQKLRSRMGRAGFARLYREFLADRMAVRVRRVYEELVGLQGG